MCFSIKNYSIGRMSINIMASQIIQREDFNGHYEGSLFTLDLQICKSRTSVKKWPSSVTNTAKALSELQDQCVLLLRRNVRNYSRDMNENLFYRAKASPSLATKAELQTAKETSACSICVISSISNKTETHNQFIRISGQGRTHKVLPLPSPLAQPLDLS